MRQYRVRALIVSSLLSLCLAFHPYVTEAKMNPLSLAEVGPGMVSQRTRSDGLSWKSDGGDGRRFHLVPITPENVDQIDQISAYKQPAPCTATFSPNGKYLALTRDRAEIALWDVAEGKVATTLEVKYPALWGTNIAFSPDSTLVAATSTLSCGLTHVRMWRVASGQLLFDYLNDIQHMVTSVAFSPDGSLVAVGTACAIGAFGSIKMWDTASGMLRSDIHIDSGGFAVAFSPDGALLAAATSDEIGLWDVAAGVLHKELRGYTGFVSSVAFSQGGTKLVSGGDEARLWDVTEGEHRYLFEGHSRFNVVVGAPDVAFSADGRLVVTGGGSHSLRFWNTATGAALAAREIGAKDDYFKSVTFNSDSTLLATCGYDQMLRLWGIQRQ